MKLTCEQVASFHREGCLVVDGYLDDEENDSRLPDMVECLLGPDLHVLIAGLGRCMPEWEQ